MTVEANKDEGVKCLLLAKKALQGGDKSKAIRLGEKAMRLYPSDEVKQFLVMAQVDNGKRSQQTSSSQAEPSSSQTESSQQQKSTAGVRNRSAQSSQHSSSATSEQSTPEQRALVNKILQAKDFYQTMGVPKTANLDEIKRAYRKLALKLHPDKNKAPRSDEAFKEVSRAFQCLQDPDKRQFYDRTGHENANQQAQARANAARAAGGAHYFTADDIYPEQIFRQFFQGGMGPFGPTVFGNMHAYRGGFQRRQQARGRPQQDNTVFTLTQLLPVLLLLLMIFVSNFNDPHFSLKKHGKYKQRMVTNDHGVLYYVQSQHDTNVKYPPGSHSRRRVESKIENEFMDQLRTSCYRELQYQQQVAYFRGFEQAKKTRKPSCDELYTKFGVNMDKYY